MNKYWHVGKAPNNQSQRRSAAQPREDEPWVAKVQKADAAEPAVRQCPNTLSATKSQDRTSNQGTHGHVRQCNGVPQAGPLPKPQSAKTIAPKVSKE
jgi:hypothetical protein